LEKEANFFSKGKNIGKQTYQKKNPNIFLASDMWCLNKRKMENVSLNLHDSSPLSAIHNMRNTLQRTVIFCTDLVPKTYLIRKFAHI
jgi:hypothetical protein